MTPPPDTAPGEPASPDAQAVARRLAALARRLAETRGGAGIEIATTPKDEVWRDGRFSLCRYRPVVARPRLGPLVILHGLVGRHTMTDLEPGRSLVERLLKGNWLSGRELVVETEHIMLRKHDEVERQIDPQQHVNVLAWHFVVQRSRRVRKGWHVVGLSLEQNGDYVPVYTLASPEDFEILNEKQLFTRLERPKRTDDRTKTSMRQAGEQRRLLEAEQDRGYNGAELTVEEFKSYLKHLQTNHPSWMTG